MSLTLCSRYFHDQSIDPDDPDGHIDPDTIWTGLCEGDETATAWTKAFFSDYVEHSVRPVMVLGPGEYEDKEADPTSTESCEKATDETLALWPLSSCTHSPVSLRQSRTVQSSEADATSAESCEKATDETLALGPLSSCTHSPVSLHQSRTVSQEAEAISAESGEKTTDLTESLWPLSSCTYSPVSLRQSRTVQSSEALATKKHKVVLRSRPWPSLGYTPSS
jgi:hypothetical protein